MNSLKSFDKVFKKVVAISILLFFLLSISLLVGNATIKSNQLGIKSNPTNTQSNQNNINQSQNQQTSLRLTAGEVSKHNSDSDCWLIIDGKVYNVTGFLSQHPGGGNLIVPFCGQDASSAFHSRGGRGEDHSPFAKDLLNIFFVGNLGESVNIKAPNSGSNGSSVATPTPFQLRQRFFFEDD